MGGRQGVREGCRLGREWETHGGEILSSRGVEHKKEDRRGERGKVEIASDTEGRYIAGGGY